MLPGLLAAMLAGLLLKFDPSPTICLLFWYQCWDEARGRLRSGLTVV